MALAELPEETEGESYFASVSDLMVGILFVFLLMLTVFALNFRDAEHDQLVERARYEQAERSKLAAEEHAKREAALAEARKVRNDRLRQLLRDAVSRLERDIQERTAARDRLLASLKQSLSDRGIRVSVEPASGILRLSEDLLFNVSESSIPKDKHPRLVVLAEVLSQILPCYAQGGTRDGCDPNTGPILETVLIEGHTDRQGYRRRPAPTNNPGAENAGVGDHPQPAFFSLTESEAMNDRLSTERALNVFKELREVRPSLVNLVNGDRLPLLGVSGYGSRRPLPDAQGSNQKDFQKNRRIDLRFVLSSRTSPELTKLRDEIRKMLESPL